METLAYNGAKDSKKIRRAFADLDAKNDGVKMYAKFVAIKNKYVGQWEKASQRYIEESRQANIQTNTQINQPLNKTPKQSSRGIH